MTLSMKSHSHVLHGDGRDEEQAIFIAFMKYLCQTRIEMQQNIRSIFG